MSWLYSVAEFLRRQSSAPEQDLEADQFATTGHSWHPEERPWLDQSELRTQDSKLGPSSNRWTCNIDSEIDNTGVCTHHCLYFAWKTHWTSKEIDSIATCFGVNFFWGSMCFDHDWVCVSTHKHFAKRCLTISSQKWSGTLCHLQVQCNCWD